MATQSYRKTVSKAPARQYIESTKEAPRTVGKFDNLAAQFNQRKLNSIEGINQHLQSIVMLEAEDNAKKAGAEKAQKDFAEIQKLEDFKSGLIETAGNVEESTAMIDTTAESEYYQSQITATDEKIGSYLDKGSQFNISERVRAENLNKMYLDKINIDATATINDVFLANKENPQAFEKEANKLLDNLQGVPEQFRETVKYNIKNSIGNVKRKATANLKIKQDDEITANRNNTLNLLNNNITQAAFDGGETAQDLIKMQSVINDQIVDGNITQVQGSSYMTKMKTEINSQKAYGGYNDIITSRRTDAQKIKDGYQYAEDFLEAKNPMSQGEETAIYNKLKSRAKSFEIAIKAGNAGQIKVDSAFLTKVVKRLTAGQPVGQTDIDRATTISVKQDKQQELNFALTAIESVNQFQTLTPTSQMEMIESIEDAIEIKDIQGESTLDMYQQLDILKKKFADNTKKIKEDPIGYVIANPLDFGSGTYAPVKLDKFDASIKVDENGKPMLGKYIDDITNELGTRYRNKDNFKEFTGNYKTLSPDETNLLNRRYNSMGRQDKSVFLKSLIKQVDFGEANKVFGEMWKKNASSSLIAASFYAKGGADNIDVSDNILRGQEIAKEKLISMDTDTKAEFNEAIMSKLNAAGFAIAPDNLKIMANTVSDLWFGTTSDPDHLEDDDILQTAFDKVTNGVVEYNGRKVFAPAYGKDEDDIEEWIETISTDENTFLEDNNKLPNGYEDWAAFKADLADGRFYLESTGTGAYRLKTKNGQVPFVGEQPFILRYNTADQIDETKPDAPWFKFWK